MSLFVDADEDMNSNSTGLFKNGKTFSDLTPRPHAMPVIDPFSVTESFLTDQVGVEIELDRPSALSAEEIVDGYLPTKYARFQFKYFYSLKFYTM